jgi:hypothetical protein
MSIAGRIEAFFVVPSGVTISVSNNGGGPTVVSIAAGSYTITSFCAYLQAALTAQRAPSSGSWSVTVSTGASGTGLVTIAVTADTYSITWTSTVLRNLLGFTANIATQATVTGTINAGGLWLPGCPLQIDGDPDSAPPVIPMLGVESPYGVVTTYSAGGLAYVHERLAYSHVTRDRAHVVAETTPGASFQQWLKDTQWALGHAWFSLASAFQIYWSNVGVDRIVGYELNAGAGPTNGWSFSPPIVKLTDHVKIASSPWLGMWRIELPRIVSQG